MSDKKYKITSNQIWFTQSIDFNSGSLQNIAPPTSSLDAATKRYVDENAPDISHLSGSIYITGSLTISGSDPYIAMYSSGTLYQLRFDSDGNLLIT